MNIYPAVDILNGQAVRLRQGRKEDLTIYGQPLEMARRWAQAGAEWLHVVDLDGAFEGSPKNHASIAAIAAALPALQLQVGGGMRSMATLDRIFDSGVRRAVLGTSAVTDAFFVREALKRWGDRIAIGIDARDGIAKVSGWTEDSRIGAIDLARRLENDGAKRVIYTDISRDGVLVGPNIPALTQMIEDTSLEVIASGGVSSIDDVRALSEMKEPRLDGVIIGKALYEKRFTLEEALEAGAYVG
ncbi:MAG TPA: 1-(5-phosphoribosyl)-5-[(5-phosphoribosylamino)methylideneamino]imidazole-4-carboxamide isomerase [Terriglobia bacterium]|nr:1-(5-phosphoribosyl)-5-[(5-phosphoribosylamino)methylideneamino]imidazole-4-carboxamide isomerase [Terriglobia bacterium]